MKQALFTLFGLFVGLSVSAGYVCSDTVLSKSYACSDSTSSHILDPSLFHGSSGQRALSITFNVRVNSICSLSNTDLPHLAVVTVTSSDGTERRIFDFQLNTATKYLVGTSETTTGIQTVTYTNYQYTNLNDWMTVVGSVDLSTGAIGIGGWLGTTSIGVTSGSSYNYGTWQFDSSLKIYLCSDIGGASPFSCDISQFKVVYTTYALRSPLLLGSTPVLIADYRLEEDTGYMTKNSLNNAQIAYFGAATSSAADTTNSSPAWSSPAPGLSFTDPSQYLNVPVYTLLPLDGRSSTLSVNIILWIKVSSFPSSGTQYIYRYSSSDLSTDRFSLQLTSAGKITCTYGSGTSTSSSALTTSTWTMVAARITYLAMSGSNTYISINFGGTSVAQGYVIASTLPTFTNTDVTRLGGFVGQVGNLQIFTPGVQVVNNPSCGTGCTIDIGNLNPAYCMYPIHCPDGQYANEYVCNQCPTGCSKCTSSTSCYACQNGFGLDNSLCSPCPSAAYQTVNNQCVLGASCPSGQYLANSQCLSCQSPCATCSGTSTTCTSCINGYVQQGSTCNLSQAEAKSNSTIPLAAVLVPSIVGTSAVVTVAYFLVRYIRGRRVRVITPQTKPNNIETVPSPQPGDHASPLQTIQV